MSRVVTVRRRVNSIQLLARVDDRLPAAEHFAQLRIFVPHVDDAGADLDARSPCADGREQRERRRELVREVMHAKVRAVCARLFAATASSIDCCSTSRADCVADWRAALQWPKDRSRSFACYEAEPFPLDSTTGRGVRSFLLLSGWRASQPIRSEVVIGT